MQLSTHFTLEELISSSTARQHGIKNTPSPEQIENLKLLCNNILEPIREKLNTPLYISSGFRCEKLNSLIGGSKYSQHLYAQAADIQIFNKSLTNKDLFDCIVSMVKSGEITIGQCIWEGGTDECPNWCHVSLPYKKTNQILRMHQVYDKHLGKYRNTYEDLTSLYL